MENKDNKGECVCGEGCGCYMCKHGGHRVLLWVLIGIIVLIFVFAAGVKLGELRGAFGGYGRHGGYMIMRTPYGYGMNGAVPTGPGMMGLRVYNGNGMMQQGTSTTLTGK